MDKELFKQKLSEVADWVIPDVVVGPKTKRVGRKSAEEEYQENHENTFLEMFNGVNPTFPPQLQDVRCSCECEDCGKFCEQGRRIEKKKFIWPRPHWRQRCVNCNLTLHPKTRKYSMSPSQASSYFSYLTSKSQNSPEKK